MLQDLVLSSSKHSGRAGFLMLRLHDALVPDLNPSPHIYKPPSKLVTAAEGFGRSNIGFCLDLGLPINGTDYAR